MRLRRAMHYNVILSCEEMEKTACWIDLRVPYCVECVEANGRDERGLE
jgi:hypothetical protein